MPYFLYLGINNKITPIYKAIRKGTLPVTAKNLLIGVNTLPAIKANSWKSFKKK